MRLVAAQSAKQLCCATTAEAIGDNRLAIGHEDGTISLYESKSDLSFLWVNPGEKVAYVTALDVNILACFCSGIIKLLSLDTGLVVAEAVLPVTVSGVYVLEHYVACWSRLSPKLWILQRSNLALWQCIDTESFVLNLFSVPRGLSLACSSDIYMVKHESDGQFRLRKVFHVDSPFVAATALKQRLLLVRPRRWSLFSVGDDTQKFDEEFKVDPPSGALFLDVVSTSLGAFIKCSTGAAVLVRESNIQLLDACEHSRGLMTADALIIRPDLSASQMALNHGEVEWLEHRLPVTLTRTKYLLGCADANVTAQCDGYVGTADGKVNGVTVFPAPVLQMDGKTAQSAVAAVSLPLQDINVMLPSRTGDRPRDKRVSILTASVDTVLSRSSPDEGKDAWLGVSTGEWASLRPLSVSPSASVLALLALENYRSLEQLLKELDLTSTTVAQFEDVAIAAATADNHDLCGTVASILDKIWTSRRVSELMKSAGPRSLQVLSAVFPYIDIQRAAMHALIVSMLDGPRADREAVLWVFEHKLSLVSDLAIPFASLKGLSEDTVTRFAERMVSLDDAKLLRDAAEATAPSTSAVPTDEATESAAETNAMKVLLAALSSQTQPQFPSSDEALVKLVALVVPAVHQRIPGAKKILAKLLSQSQVQYHQGKQRLLVPTPNVRNQAALVFEFGDGDSEPIVLEEGGKDTLPRAETSPMLFSGDGKCVYVHIPQGRLVWHFGGALRALFKSKQPIVPVHEPN